MPNLIDHELQINADHVLVFGPDLLPTSNFIEVHKTDFDRNKLRPINNSRYNDCFVLRQKDTVKARLRAKTTKIQMDILTDQPGMVVFKPEIINGICLETKKNRLGPTYLISQIQFSILMKDIIKKLNTFSKILEKLLGKIDRRISD